MEMFYVKLTVGNKFSDIEKGDNCFRIQEILLQRSIKYVALFKRPKTCQYIGCLSTYRLFVNICYAELYKLYAVYYYTQRKMTIDFYISRMKFLRC